MFLQTVEIKYVFTREGFKNQLIPMKKTDHQIKNSEVNFIQDKLYNEIYFQPQKLREGVMEKKFRY